MRGSSLFLCTAGIPMPVTPPANSLPHCTRAVALAALLFTSSLYAADVVEAPKKEPPVWAQGWKVVRIAIPKTGQIEHAFVDLESPAGQAVTLREGVLNKASGLALEKVEWTGSPVHARVTLRKDQEKAELAAEAVLVSRDDALERRSSQVKIEAKFIEMSDAVAREMLPKGMLPDAKPGALPVQQVAPSVVSLADSIALITALNQKKGIDVVSTPSIALRSGQKGTIEIIREFRYATDWEPSAGKNKPPTPVAFDTKDTGVTLEATATVDDDETIDLHLVPQVVEFLGFVAGGNQKAIEESKTDPKQPLSKRLSEMPAQRISKDTVVKSPVFATRKLDTSVTLHLGQSTILALGAVEDTKPFASPHAGRTLVAIVTPTLVPPEGPLPASVAQPPDGARAEPVAQAPPARGLPVAIPVKGKPGFVISPYSPNKGYIDVRGFPAKTEVKDPYSGKIFRLP